MLAVRRHLEALAVEKLVLQKDHRVGVADGGLQQPLGVARRIGRDNPPAGHVGEPARVALGMLRGDPCGGAVGAAEHHRHRHQAARHVERLGGRVDEMIHRLHGEVEGHELDDGLEPAHGGAHADPGEPGLGDGRVDHPASAELVEQALAHLVGALILRDLLAHEEDVGVGPHLLRHRVAQRFSNRQLNHGGSASLAPFRRAPGHRPRARPGRAPARLERSRRRR